ncbi:penicillin-binding protein 2 [Halocynthiibacter styelae]|uniref:Penicillin-binding protein 2 n=1 Tax=Halocynthiibacter styelae TaxID=2761955 RepID=A0A8J7IEZ6_9RHOB|nr:penicillin-binding protein 2 [Paenihalocynthiibacter styelae]MBI1495494.1 penicillin-binding protein 2 [Paenihalocynthiibacter styelae]
MRRPPKENEESTRGITRRGLLLGTAWLAFGTGLAARMRYLQVDQADQFRLLADENRIKDRLIAPARGLIWDRNGLPLATNEQNYRVVMVREEAGDPEEALDKLSELIPMTENDRAKALKAVMDRAPHVPVAVADRLTWEEVSAIAVNGPALPGITPEVGLSRSYPVAEDLCHVVGYVGPVSDYDLSRIEDQDPLLQIPKFQIGKSGAENKLERQLRGQAGNVRNEVNAGGRIIRELDRREGIPGDNIQLTIDAPLQNYVQARLAGEAASAVVMDVETGDLLACGSVPTFDPNKFVRGISVADYGELTGNPLNPLQGKAVQGAYPPGSTFKMVTALAAMDAGLIDTEETIYCRGYTEVGGRRFHCWKHSGHGNMNLNQSLRNSCDIYYYDIAQRVGIEKISEMARRLGLGERHALPMSAVSSGLTPTKAWKLERRGAEWVIGDSLNASIGQGFVLASPLQLAVMTSRLATGRAVEPRIVKSVNSVEVPIEEPPELGLNQNHLRAIRQGMFAVSNNRRGTAFRSRIAADGKELAGKTGTSQVSNNRVNNANVPWEQRDHALFVGFAPYDAPKYAVSVVVEHGGGGSKAAAPVARDILLFAMYGGFPPEDAYPSSARAKARQIRNNLELRDFDALRDESSQA